MTESLTRDTFSDFLVIFFLPFFAPFFCCLRHVSLLNWQISTPHLIPLNNKNFPFFPTCFLRYVTLPPPQSSLSPSFSSSIFSSFPFIFFVSFFMQAITSDYGFMQASCSLQSELRMSFWSQLTLVGSRSFVPSIVARVSPRAFHFLFS